MNLFMLCVRPLTMPASISGTGDEILLRYWSLVVNKIFNVSLKISMTPNQNSPNGNKKRTNLYSDDIH